jgi:phage terminase small subunit
MAGLTNKQRVFVEHYLTCWNATEAARQAGYAGSDDTLAAVGYENLRKPQIAAVIEARLAEKTMSADEVLVRLTEQARADIRDVFTIRETSRQGRDEESTVERHAELDLVALFESGKSHLVKSITYTKFGPKVELYDAQAALVHIGKHHGLFVDRTETKHDVTEQFLAAMMEFGRASGG